MIYVEEKDFNRQIELLEFIASSQDLNICAWLYPESNVTELVGIEVSDNSQGFIPVTTYENGFSPKCTALVLATPGSIRSFGSAYSELKKNCDSLAIYKKNQFNWFAATIGHEGMCLVQDNSLLKRLTQAGYAASTEAPSWW